MIRQSDSTSVLSDYDISGLDPFLMKFFNPVCNRLNRSNRSHTLPCTPCSFPTCQITRPLGQQTSVCLHDALGKQGRLQKICRNPCHSIGLHNVIGSSRDQRLFVVLRRHAFRRSDERCAHIGHVSTSHLNRPDLATGCHTTRNSQRPSPKTAHLLDKGKGIDPTGVAASAGRQKYQHINASLNRLPRMSDGGHICQDPATIGVNSANNIARRSNRGDHPRYAVVDHNIQVIIPSSIGWVEYQVGRDKSACAVSSIFDFRQPCIQQSWRSRIEGWKCTNNARVDRCHHKLNTAHQKHGCSYHRHPE